MQVTPDHFYYPVPSLQSLPPGFFERESPCTGLDWALETQRMHLEQTLPPYASEIAPNFSLRMLSSVDAAVYYAMIRRYRPRKVIEIGSGESTHYAALACRRNGNPCELVCIDPFPSAALSATMANYKGLGRLIEEKVEDVALTEFANCDLLFIDSTHVVKIGGDVIFEILEVVPLLPVGALVHWHDIFLPHHYPEEWVRQRLFWTEQYLVQAFLLFNRDFHVVWASHFMSQRDPAAIRRAVGAHADHAYPVSSLWVERIA